MTELLVHISTDDIEDIGTSVPQEEESSSVEKCLYHSTQIIAPCDH